MKKITLFTALLLMCQLTFAQYENFDLSKYKLPEIKRHQLDFNYNFGSDLQKNSYEESQDRSYFDLTNNLDLSYSYYRNTPKVQSNGWGTLASALNLDHTKEEGLDKIKNDFFSYYIGASFTRRVYTNSDDRWFWLSSAGLSLNQNFNHDQDLWFYDNDYTEKYKSRNLYFQPQISVGGGFGRIEQVSDARRAIYIVEDLYKNNKLNRLPDENELFTIANRVAELRNQRVFDSRLRHIYEMESLDSLLNNLNLVSDGDMEYFTSLNDMWLYGNESRYSGTRFQAEIGGKLYNHYQKQKSETYDFDYSKITTEENDNEYNEILQLNLELQSYKPIGLKWQRDLSVYLIANRRFNDSDLNDISSDYYLLLSGFQYGYDWFYNTRTNASFSLGGNYTRNEYIDNDSRSDRNVFAAYVSGSLNYYFSPRLKASVRISANNNWYQNDDTSYYKVLSFASQASLNYAIF